MATAHRRIQLLAICALVAFAALLPAGQASGGPKTCENKAFSVSASAPGLAEQICGILSEISGDLALCGLAPKETVNIEVVKSLSHPALNCLAHFDCEFDVIRVTDPALYDQFLETGNSYALLPPDALLKALVTHEVTHALVAQSAGNREIAIVDQEYIAAAMELELLDPPMRDILLAAAPVPLPPKTGLIDIWIYGLEPRKFATNAWQHFRLPENGCALVRKILGGEFTFAGKTR